MDGDHLDICDLGWAVRLKKNSNSNNKNNNTSTRSSRSITRTITSDQSQPVDDNNNDKKEWNNVHPVPPPPPGGSDPRFITPEYIMTTSGGNGSGNDVNDANCNNQNNEQTEVMKWNGYQADLWAAGLMLFSMIVGAESLFVAPIYEDKTFARLCVKGDIRGHIKKYGRVAGRTDDLSATLSEDLVDLLRSMLRANPLKRLSLDDVMAHPWVTTDEVVTPSEWICKNRHPSTTDVYNSSVAESEMIS
jgi:serine/threonine protein kinase